MADLPGLVGTATWSTAGGKFTGMTLPPRPARRRTLTRGGSLGIAAVLTATSLALLTTGSADAAGTDPYPSTAATAWLKSRLTANTLPTATPVPDSLEGALGLKVAGDTATATSIRDAIAPSSGSYTGTPSPAGDPQPDASAMVAWYVQQLGGNAAAYGTSGDLITTLAALVDGNGRLGEEANDASPTVPTTAGQIFAAAALSGASNAEAGQAVAYTGSLQCADGYFNDALPTTTTLCDTRNPSVRATALYVIATQGIAGADTSRAKAVTWLAKAQQSNGRWVADGGQGTGDVQATALAAYAVGLANRPVDAGQGALWLRGLQLANAGSCSAYPAADVGAVAPDGGAFTGTAGRVDDFTRATARSLLVLGRSPGGPAVTDNVLTAPKFSKPGRQVKASVRTAPRNLICASAPTLTATRVVAGYDSTADFTFTAGPSGATTASITDPTGQVDTATVTSLPKKKLAFSLRSKRVRTGKVEVIKVKGLAPGESVKVQFRGQRKNATVANSSGNAKLRWIVTGKRGTAKVRVTGQFNNRNRTKNIIVTRR